MHVHQIKRGEGREGDSDLSLGWEERGGGYKAKLPAARREGLSLASFSTQLSSHLYFGLSQILMCSCNMAGLMISSQPEIVTFMT